MKNILNRVGLQLAKPTLALLGFILGLGTTLSPAVSFPLNWRWSNPQPHGATILDMAYSQGLGVEVGERGQIFTSTDLNVWELRHSHVTDSLRGVTFLRNRIVVCGANGTILFADDPTAFYSVNLNTTDWLESTAASSNLVVAVGDNAAIYTSTNAVLWQRQTPPFTTWLRGVAWGPPGFVLVGENGLIASSPNGTSWSVRTSGVSQHLNRVAWVNDRFWAAGDKGTILTSPTGVTWTRQTSGATNSLFAAAGSLANQLVAGDQEVRLYQGASWANQFAGTQPAPPPPASYYGAFWDGEAYWLGGGAGMYVEGYQTNTLGPTYWAEPYPSVRTWLWAVTRTPFFYLAAGDKATLMSSDNGIDWSLLLVPNSVTNVTWMGVGAGANQYFAVGTAGAILRSTNGVTWDAVSPRPATNNLQGFVTMGNLFLASGAGGLILSSPDGITWSKRTTPTTYFLSSMALIPGGVAAAGDHGTLLTSPDGTNWTGHALGTTNWIYQIRNLNGLLLAVGQNGSLYTSTNGTAWTSRNSGTTNWLTDATFLDGSWFVVGTGGTVLTSTNLTAWSNIGTLTSLGLLGAATDQKQLLVVGAGGTILRAQVVPDLTPMTVLNYSCSNGRNLFLFAGKPDQQFALLANPVLGDTNWVPTAILDFIDGTGTLLYLDTDTPSSGTDFYRTRLLP